MARRPNSMRKTKKIATKKANNPIPNDVDKYYKIVNKKAKKRTV